MGRGPRAPCRAAANGLWAGLPTSLRARQRALGRAANEPTGLAANAPCLMAANGARALWRALTGTPTAVCAGRNNGSRAQPPVRSRSAIAPLRARGARLRVGLSGGEGSQASLTKNPTMLHDLQQGRACKLASVVGDLLSGR